MQAGWARVLPTQGDGCAPADDLVVLRLIEGNWTPRYQGPIDPQAPCAQDDGFPSAVGVDLGICRALSKRVYIPRFDRVVYKPRLIVYGAHAGLRNLRWRRWGRSVATARGVMDYADRTTSFRAPIHVRVSRVRPCGVKRTYRRMTVTFDRAADRRRWRALDGTTQYSRPS